MTLTLLAKHKINEDSNDDFLKNIVLYDYFNKQQGQQCKLSFLEYYINANQV